jgi:hypothetical protein
MNKLWHKAPAAGFFLALIVGACTTNKKDPHAKATPRPETVIVVASEERAEDAERQDEVKVNSLSVALRDPGDFVNYGAANQTKPLTIDLTLQSDPPCNAVVKCSRVDGVWLTCGRDGTPQVTIDSREIAKGFQRMFVRAECGQVVSEVLEISWFGVSPGYQKLGLERRLIGNLAHYRLERSADCSGKLRFSCRESQAAGFAECANVRMSPPKDFEIRAICESAGTSVEGPVLKDL